MTEKRLFGTDGVRGRANQFPMTCEVALALGRATGAFFREVAASPKVVIGRDTRRSGPMLENAFAAGLASMGADVWRAGIISTPGVAYLTKSMRANAGVVISASHNPFEDNGIKFFGPDGFKLDDEVELEIEKMVLSDNPWDVVTPDMIGRDQAIPDVEGRYVVYLKEQFPQDLDLDGLRVVLDCANGANYRVASTVLGELGADVITINNEPDGLNINQNCGALYPQHMCAKVIEVGADLGAAFDGDGDRLILCTHDGKIVDGDGILAITSIYLKERGRLKNDTVVATVMSNLGLEQLLQRYNIRLLRTNVGDRYVVQQMLSTGSNVGGEQSGHIVFLDNSTTGDGILALLKVLEVMQKKQESLAGLIRDFVTYPQILRNVKVTKKPPISELPLVDRAIKEAEAVLKDRGRVLVRYSGTSFMIRIMIEGEDRALINELVESIVKSVKDSGIAA